MQGEPVTLITARHRHCQLWPVRFCDRPRSARFARGMHPISLRADTGSIVRPAPAGRSERCKGNRCAATDSRQTDAATGPQIGR